MSRYASSRVIPSVFLVILAVGIFSVSARAGGAGLSTYDGSVGFGAPAVFKYSTSPPN